MEFGAGRGHRGLIIVLTFGTGIGSAVFSNGQLVPTTRSFFLFEELNSIRPALELTEIADVSSKKDDGSLARRNSISEI